MKSIATMLLVVLLTACGTPPKALLPDGSQRVPVNKTMPQPK